MPITIDPTTDAATEIANLRDDCIAAHEYIELLRERIAALESDVTAESEYAARYAMDLHHAEIRANTYRCRARSLMHKLEGERIWAAYYHAEADRLQRENDALHAELETIKDANTAHFSDRDMAAIVRSVLS